MKDNFLPEEKLLRLIKNQKKKETPSQLPVGPDTKSALVRQGIFFLPQNYIAFLSLKKIILGLFILSCIYLVIVLAYPWFALQKIDLPKLDLEAPIEDKPLEKEETRPYSYYLEGIRQRQIFASGSPTQELSQPVAIASADLVKDISLIGIISGANPQAIIEDKKLQKTFYVSKGQLIGELQVEEIKEGKIILNYKGQRYELYL